MIISSSSTNRTPLSPTVSITGKPVSPPSPQRNDQLSTENGSHLKAALEGQPGIRPEMLARARALAADSGYPSEATIKLLAQHILSSPDPISDES